MKAMVLAGGMSTRLYPLTKAVPKPLVPISGEPTTAHVLRYLRSFGIEDVTINVHYLADQIERSLGDGSPYGVNLRYLREERLMGSAGAVKGVEDVLRDGTFVVIGCDDVTDLNLEALIAFHRKRGAIATIGLVQADDVSEYGVVILDEQGRITAFQEKPAKGTERSHLVNTGIYVFEPEIFDRIPAGVFYDFGKQVFPLLQAENAAFYGLESHGAYWCDVGTPAEYRRASNDILAGVIRLPGARARGWPPSAVLGDEVRIEGDVRIGERTSLGAGVRVIGPSVIGDDCIVEAGAVVERSIVWNDCRIGRGARVIDSIVGMEYEVEAERVLRDAIVANEREKAAT